jgi:hypothetical protein
MKQLTGFEPPTPSFIGYIRIKFSNPANHLLSNVRYGAGC